MKHWFALFLVCGSALAAPLPPAAALSPDEQAVAALVRGSEAFEQHWRQAVRVQATAAEQLRRAALIKRCPLVAGHPAPFLDATLRQAIAETAQASRALLAEFDGAPLQRHLLWPAIQAFGGLAPAPRQALRELLATPEGRQALSHRAVQQVLLDFAERQVQPWSGRTEPAAVLWLKAYAVAEQAEPALRAQIQRLDPQHAAAWDALRPLAEHTPADAPALARLTEALAPLAPKLAQALLDNLPPAQRQRHDLLAEFEMAVALQRPMPWNAAGTTATEPPMPEGLMPRLLATGPVQLARVPLARLCPEN